jgi:hypothetical protein
MLFDTYIIAKVVPTHVGVFLEARFVEGAGAGCPHARGGVPPVSDDELLTILLSPRTWGCSAHALAHAEHMPVVPTHVGVFRGRGIFVNAHPGCPHARGGVPGNVAVGSLKGRLSPRTWGCSGRPAAQWRTTSVVPTHVGVFRVFCLSKPNATCCPHARGGVPKLSENELNGLTVVPTHVGVFRGDVTVFEVAFGCPHARGGVPLEAFIDNKSQELSPRTWGCSYKIASLVACSCVVPTHVGVFHLGYDILRGIQSCPHARGGVPTQKDAQDFLSKLSPRTWGCSLPLVTATAQSRVVPTHVGVFRCFCPLSAMQASCPHARGGVPFISAIKRALVRLSPRTWGCSLRLRLFWQSKTVVPTHVGVFRARTLP